ncbi:MAG: serine/threonine-protein kinase, partial [Planctomycetia bacterium]|nr:serine/threonine-protein kinase [Planctomycetia bacterium]
MADEIRAIALTADFQTESRYLIESCAAEHPELTEEIRHMGGVIASLEEEGRLRQVRNSTPLEWDVDRDGNGVGVRGDAARTAHFFPIVPGRLTGAGKPDSDETFRTENVPEIRGFRMLRELGRGGMGVVFEAEQTALRRRVAVKILPGQNPEEECELIPENDGGSGHTLESLCGDESSVRRFLREARIVARLHHTNIVPVLEAGCEQGVYWYAMQLIHGLSLDRILKKLRSGDLKELRDYGIPETDSPEYFQWVCQLFLQVLDALAHVHHQGLLHRDIKPGNLILEPDGRIWITDFGLARMKDRPGNGLVVGTLRYMAPEQRLGEATTLTDLYAVGLTLYEMFSLQPAFTACSRDELIEQVRKGQISCPLGILVPQMSLDLVKITEKAIHSAPEERYQTAEAFADDLRRYLEGRPVNARPVSVWEKFLRWRRRSPWIYYPLLTAATAVITAFIAGWSGWMITHSALEDEAFQRRQAESNLEMAVKERELAREQRDRAERNLGLSLDILDTAFPTLVSRKAFAVYTIPSPSERVRLETLLNFYEELIQGNETNPRLRAELARTLSQIGTVQLTLGVPRDAIVSFEKSLEYEMEVAGADEADTGAVGVDEGGSGKSEGGTGVSPEEEEPPEGAEFRQVRVARIYNELGYARRLVG